MFDESTIKRIHSRLLATRCSWMCVYLNAMLRKLLLLLFLTVIVSDVFIFEKAFILAVLMQNRFDWFRFDSLIDYILSIIPIRDPQMLMMIYFILHAYVVGNIEGYNIIIDKKPWDNQQRYRRFSFVILISQRVPGIHRYSRTLRHSA